MTAPAGYSTVSAYLAVPEAAEVMRFAETVFGAAPVDEPMMDGDRLRHAAVRIGDSVVMLGAPEGEARHPALLHVYVDDCDGAHARALQAGATELDAPADQAYGDRRSSVRDMAGNVWFIAERRP